jgi:hypothetical protein
MRLAPISENRKNKKAGRYLFTINSFVETDYNPYFHLKEPAWMPSRDGTECRQANDALD